MLCEYIIHLFETSKFEIICNKLKIKIVSSMPIKYSIDHGNRWTNCKQYVVKVKNQEEMNNLENEFMK